MNCRRRMTCDQELVVRHSLVKRVRQQPQALHLIRRRAHVLGFVVLLDCINGLLNQRLACRDYANEGSLVRGTTPIS